MTAPASDWIKQRISGTVHPFHDMSRIETWLDDLSTASKADVLALQAAVQQETQRRQDEQVFSRFRRKCLPADVQDDVSSEESPGEFRENVQKFWSTWSNPLRCRQPDCGLSSCSLPFHVSNTRIEDLLSNDPCSSHLKTFLLIDLLQQSAQACLGYLGQGSYSKTGGRVV